MNHDDTLFDLDRSEPEQTAVNAIRVIAEHPDLGLSGPHRSIPALAEELARKHKTNYLAMGEELHQRECFRCWQAYSTPAFTPHSREQVAEIAELYGSLIADVVEGRRRLVFSGVRS